MAIDERRIDQVVERLGRWLDDAGQREKAAEERARRLAETQRDGLERLTKAVEHGLKVIADAVGDSHR